MTTEFLETKAVDRAVYSFYFKAVGVQITVYILLLNIIQQALSIGTNVWLSEWSDDPQAGEVKLRKISGAFFPRSLLPSPSFRAIGACAG